MKKVYLVTVISLMVIALVFCGCAKTSPGSDEVIELKFSHPWPPVAPQVAPWMEWGENVEKLTDGRVKIVFYPTSSLVQITDSWNALLTNVSDIELLFAWLVPELEFETMFNLPCLGWTNENMLDIMKQVETEVPELTGGRSAAKTLWLQMSSLETFHFVDKEVRVPEDIKGLKMIATPTADPFLKSCGAVSAGLNPTDFYGALEKGVVDGTLMHGMGLNEWKMDEVTKYHLYCPVSSSVMAVMMNIDKWNSLPADIQKIIDKTLPDVEKATENVFLTTEKEMHDKLAASAEHTVIEPSNAEIALWVERALPTHQEWIDQMTAKGYPAQEAYNTLMEVIENSK